MYLFSIWHCCLIPKPMQPIAPSDVYALTVCPFTLTFSPFRNTLCVLLHLVREWFCLSKLASWRSEASILCYFYVSSPVFNYLKKPSSCCFMCSSLVLTKQVMLCIVFIQIHNIAQHRISAPDKFFTGWFSTLSFYNDYRLLEKGVFYFFIHCCLPKIEKKKETCLGKAFAYSICWKGVSS